ncbi:DNA primase [Cryptosporangium aurantiacum]|uniref:DNA primase n=1 Tax=Cryptosporangium aurantiacum TaxID=134849 RepID=A0A1M7JZC6_9ACTN|nr:DNA primase [Cryptosporangium aurantiacum]SHM58410.1 DNA primase [Cryptosporangium aurantiacum]
MDRLLEAHQRAAAYYAGQLARLPGGPAVDYLRSRGIPRALARARPWRLGYAPPARTGLSDHLRRLGFTADELLTAGLAIASQGRTLDAFRDRVMFPVRDRAGRVRAFVGRDLSGNPRVPRYRNSATTPIYTKSNHLYALAEAFEARRPPGAVVIVEGPADAVALARLPPGPDGRLAAVSTCGTALATGQVALLTATVVPGTPVVVCFDPDDAGRRAADRAYQLLRDWTGPVDAVVLPPGTDPAALVARSGPRGADRMLRESRTSLLAALVDARLAGRRLDEVEGRVTALRAAGALLRRAVARDTPLLPGIAHSLSVRLGFDGTTVLEAVYLTDQIAERGVRGGGGGRRRGVGRTSRA